MEKTTGPSLHPTASLVEADLHCHTSASDGLLSPTEVVRLAAACGLRAVGITDHDTIDGWVEALAAGRKYGVDIVRGIELNTDWHGVEVHILGYEFDPESGELPRRLEGLRRARWQRMEAILDRLGELGIPLAVSEVERYVQGEAVGRPHIAQALVARGYARSMREAFERYLGQGAPAYVPRFKIAPEEGIRLIRAAHGVAVLAHPGVRHLDEGIPNWVKAGLQGIEVSHSEHGPAEEKHSRELGVKYHLVATGGSDFHGEARKPGVALGRWGVPYAVVEQIRALARGELDI